jgi:hypothetical protein
MAYVYKHLRNDTKEVFYIGISKFEKRKLSHKNRNPHWHHIVNKFGYVVEIVENELSWEAACEKEKQLIKQYGRRDLGLGPLVNMTDGGEGFVSKHKPATIEKFKQKTLSEYTKQKIRKAKTGTTLSDETKLKMSKSRIGYVVSDATKDKLRKAHIGRKVSPIGIENMKKAQQAIITSERIENLRKSHSHQAHKIIQYNIDNSFIRKWDSIGEASKSLGIRKINISDCCKGKYGCKSAGGYKWKYQ